MWAARRIGFDMRRLKHWKRLFARYRAAPDTLRRTATHRDLDPCDQDPWLRDRLSSSAERRAKVFCLLLSSFGNSCPAQCSRTSFLERESTGYGGRTPFLRSKASHANEVWLSRLKYAKSACAARLPEIHLVWRQASQVIKPFLVGDSDPKIHPFSPPKRPLIAGI